ncbi:MAG: hypothetical protein ACE5GV_13435 [Candidatus Scalindua sp.]
MSTKGKFSDRRCNERRLKRKPYPALEALLPDQNIREGDRRSDPRRQSERQNVSFEVLFDDQNGEAINVSASGVYFEVATNDIEAFSPGAIIPLQINIVTAAPYSKERKLKLTGRGLVIRNCIIEDPEHENSLGIAVKFVDKLNIKVDSDDYPEYYHS